MNKFTFLSSQKFKNEDLITPQNLRSKLSALKYNNIIRKRNFDEICATLRLENYAVLSFPFLSRNLSF